MPALPVSFHETRTGYEIAVDADGEVRVVARRAATFPADGRLEIGPTGALTALTGRRTVLLVWLPRRLCRAAHARGRLILVCGETGRERVLPLAAPDVERERAA